MVQTVFIPLDGDVSWLITVAERVLNGARLYVDLFEVNPPASVWLYLPPVWLAEATGARAEAAVAGMAILAALVSNGITLRIAGRLQAPPSPVVTAAVLGILTLVLPGGLFAQREHFAVLLALPMLAGLALIAERGELPRRALIALGIASGLVVVIKPHFALAVLFAGVWAGWRSGSLRVLIPAASAGVVVIAAYAGAVFCFAPAYFDYLPLLAAVYLPMHEAWPALLAGPVVFIPAAVLVLAVLFRPARVSVFAGTLLLGMLGFAVAGVLQAKGYANHALPGSVLGFAGLAVLASGEVTRERRRRIGAAALLLALTQVYANCRILPQPGLADALRRVAPPHPAMITLGFDLITGHPAVRNVDGRWIGSRASLFTAAGAQSRMAQSPSERDQLARWYAQDLQSFADDVASGRPDVVLVEASIKRWAGREPVLVAAMRPYRPVVRTGGIELWVRR